MKIIGVLTVATVAWLSFSQAHAGICNEAYSSPTPSATEARIERIRAEVDAILLDPPLHGEPAWTCRFGGCLPMSKQLYQALVDRTGEKFRFAHLYGVGSSNFAPSSFTVHAFIVELSGPEPIIIDPTFLQFRAFPDRYSGNPVFIGTRTELVSFFKDPANRPVPQSRTPAGWKLDVEKLVYSVWPLKPPGLSDGARIELIRNFKGPLGL